jgi:hypothetical protein
MPTCFLPLQTSGHDLGTVADGCDGPIDKQRRAVEEDSEARCGWCFFRPQFLQRFRTAKWVLFWLCWAGAVQGRKLYFYYSLLLFIVSVLGVYICLTRKQTIFLDYITLHSTGLRYMEKSNWEDAYPTWVVKPQKKNKKKI